MKGNDTNQEVAQLREQIAALEQLLEVYERETLDKSARLEQALADVRQHAHQLSLSEARYRQLAQRKELLNRLVVQVRQSLDLETILATAVTEIRQQLQIDACIFWWYSPVLTNFQAVCESHTAAITQNLQQRYPMNGDADSANQAFLKELPPNTLPYPEASFLKSVYEEYAQLMLPVQTRSKQLGVIHCLHREKTREWEAEEVELLQAVANQLAIALDQAELYEQSCAATAQAQAQAQELEKALQEIQRTPQLIQTEKMASLGQLVAGVAHEINNPVNFIHGNLLYASRYVEDLLDLLQLYQTEYPTPTPTIQKRTALIEVDFIAEDLPKLFASMRLGAERIREIVRLLRTFSRLDEAAIKAVDIHEGIDSTLMILQNRLKPQTDRPGIQVIKEYGELPLVQCYAGQLNQVFMNILANAIDALEEQFRFTGSALTALEGLSLGAEEPSTPAKTLTRMPFDQPTIRIHTEVKSNEILPNSDSWLLAPAYVVIHIIDNGPGMSPAIQQRLFDPFFTTKPVGKGTGLGMSISYHIVTETHKGRLQCISAPGQGTEFVIEIPVHQSNAS
ncbi:ATP-binding protein [Leptothermofonsia sp. ETS-13]|uniref:GAF domain-containing sensor histidine kinase n=1 Tax=Leptothermofonsia sp. ETS-13 TaxID=3035696 RepID=UPI003B9E9308